MDDFEEGIHKILNITSYKTLKEEGFYKKISPIFNGTKKANFHAEYQNQYLQLTAYYKLYFAYKKLDSLINKNNLNLDNIEMALEKIDNINSFITNIFSVCDILSKQIFIALTSSVKGIRYIYLHKIKSKEKLKEFKNDTINFDRFEKYFIKILEPITFDNSWYDELQYYRNQISHGMLIPTYNLQSGNSKLLKKDIIENEKKFGFLIQNESVHNKNPTEQIKDDLKDKFNNFTIYEQFTEYFEEVKKLASDVWEKMHELYRDEGVQVDWKLG